MMNKEVKAGKPEPQYSYLSLSLCLSLKSPDMNEKETRKAVIAILAHSAGKRNCFTLNS